MLGSWPHHLDCIFLPLYVEYQVKAQEQLNIIKLMQVQFRDNDVYECVILFQFPLLWKGRTESKEW